MTHHTKRARNIQAKLQRRRKRSITKGLRLIRELPGTLQERWNSPSLLLWGILIGYAVYTSAINGPIQVALESHGYKERLYAIAISLYLGFLTGSVLENLIEHYSRLRPATIGLIGAGILLGCSLGYLSWNLESFIKILALRFLEGMGLNSIFHGATFLFKRHYEDRLLEVQSKRNLIIQLVVLGASAGSFFLLEYLSFAGWMSVTGFAAALAILVLYGMLWWNTRRESERRREASHEISEKTEITRTSLLFYMLGILGPTTAIGSAVLIYFPGYVQEALTPQQQATLVTSIALAGQTVGNLYGGRKLRGIRTNKILISLLGLGYLPICAGLVLLLLVSSDWLLTAGTLFLALCMIGGGQIIVNNLVDASLQLLRQSMGKQEGVKSIATEVVRIIVMITFGGVILSNLGRPLMWALLAFVGLIPIFVLSPWAAFIRRKTGGKKEIGKLRHELAFTLVGLSLMFDLRPRI